MYTVHCSVHSVHTPRRSCTNYPHHWKSERGWRGLRLGNMKGCCWHLRTKHTIILNIPKHPPSLPLPVYPRPPPPTPPTDRGSEEAYLIYGSDNHRQTYIDLWRGTPFSLLWLVADGNLSESGLARLIGSWFKILCMFNYTTLLLNSRVLLLFNETKYRSCQAILYRPCHLKVSWARIFKPF